MEATQGRITDIERRMGMIEETTGEINERVARLEGALLAFMARVKNCLDELRERRHEDEGGGNRVIVGAGGGGNDTGRTGGGGSNGGGGNNSGRGENRNDEEDRASQMNWVIREEDRGRRIEVPYFHSDDPYGWVVRAERYFRVNRVPEEEQVETASICLEGQALSWFQWWEPRHLPVTWESMRAAILQRFHVSSSENPYEALMCLRQLGSVAEYRAQFETLFAPLRQADEGMMQAAFLNGLKEEIRAEVRMHLDETVEHMMCRPQRGEEKEMVCHRGRTGGRGGVSILLGILVGLP